MPLLFQPSPPPCAKCGTTTVLTPAFEEGQRVFAVRCPACGRAGTYTLDYSALASGEPDHGAASVARFNLGNFLPCCEFDVLRALGRTSWRQTSIGASLRN